MKDPNKFNVVIIEDFELDFKFMRNSLIELYNVFPETEDDWEDIRSQVASLYSDGNKIVEIDKSREFIKTLMEKYEADLYIVDYLLMEENNSCNGIRLCEEFVHNKKVLLITKNPNDENNEIKNEIADFSDQKVNGNEIHTMFKEKLSNSFRNKFVTKVKRILPHEKSAGEKDEPMDTTKIKL